MLKAGFVQANMQPGLGQLSEATSFYNQNIIVHGNPELVGGHATELIAKGEFGRMVALKGDDIASIPLEEVAGKLKLVTEDHDLVIQGRRMGICFG